jgi:hypothetical protein
MTDHPPLTPPQPGSSADAEPLEALLDDLRALSAYLRQRGQQTYEMAQKFAINARKHPETRAYDERQATMLEYQHYIWNEIAGLLDKLIAVHSEAIDHNSADESAEEG